jgi:hypothetical protein
VIEDVGPDLEAVAAAFDDESAADGTEEADSADDAGDDEEGA